MIVTRVPTNIIFIDFETYYDSATKYSLRNMSMTEYIFDSRFDVQGFAIQINDGTPKWVTRADAAAVIKEIDWSNAAVVAHNVKFDGAILHWKYAISPKMWIDTKALAMAKYGASLSSYSLSSVGEKLGLPSKGMLNTDGKKELTKADEDTLSVYCLRDLEICEKAYRLLESSVSTAQLRLMDWTVRCFIEPKMELDAALAEVTRAEIEKAKEKIISDIGIDKKILSSNPKFAKYLRELGYAVPEKANKKGKMIPAFAATDEGFREMLESEDPVLSALCAARMESKKTMETKRAEKLMAIGSFGRYPFDIIYSGAKQTHRFSGGNGGGGNPQNFPRESALRKCIKAPGGTQLLVADFNAIEARVLAFLARDVRLMTMFREKRDPYCVFATEVYNRPITKADKLERKFGKTAILGLGYQMGAKRFKSKVKTDIGMNIDEDKAVETVKIYRNFHLGISNFWDTCETVIKMMAEGKEAPFPGFPVMRVKKDGLILPSGLELRFQNLRRVEGDKGRMEWVFDKFGSKKTEIEETKLYGGKLTENICQALAGELCKEAILRMINDGFPPSGQVHDELLVVAKDADVERARAALLRAMTLPPHWWPDIALVTEVGIGPNWGEAKL